MTGYWSDELIEHEVFVRRPEDRVAYVPVDRIGVYGEISRQQVQPASLDVRLSGHFINPFAEEPGEMETATLDPNFIYVLGPGDCLLASLVERVRIPSDALARVEGKSTWARQFLTVHSAGFIDPGFHGDVTLELKNDGKMPLSLRPGVPIAQISFCDLAAPALRPYGSEGLGSHYQGQTGATRHRS